MRCYLLICTQITQRKELNDKYIESMIEEMELRELELQQISIDDCFEDVIYAIE